MGTSPLARRARNARPEPPSKGGSRYEQRRRTPANRHRTRARLGEAPRQCPVRNLKGHARASAPGAVDRVRLHDPDPRGPWIVQGSTIQRPGGHGSCNLQRSTAARLDSNLKGLRHGGGGSGKLQPGRASAIGAPPRNLTYFDMERRPCRHGHTAAPGSETAGQSNQPCDVDGANS